MKLAYEIFLPSGESENRDLSPIIFLHGRMDSKKTWRKFAPEIAKKTGREIYTLDTRNHGDSPWSDEMDFEVITDDLEEFMDDHNISMAILIGHSMGGRTAMTLALRKPECVEKLIVEDMDTKNYSSTAKRSVQQILHLLKASLAHIPPGADEITAKEAVIKVIIDKLPKARAQLEESQIFDLDTLPLKKEGNSYAWQANLDVLEDMLMSDKVNQKLSGVYTGDALFLYGTDSYFGVGEDEDIYKYFPAATKIGIEGAGHLIHHDFPGQFLSNVLKFILGPESK